MEESHLSAQLFCKTETRTFRNPARPTHNTQTKQGNLRTLQHAIKARHFRTLQHASNARHFCTLQNANKARHLRTLQHARRSSMASPTGTFLVLSPVLSNNYPSKSTSSTASSPTIAAAEQTERRFSTASTNSDKGKVLRLSPAHHDLDVAEQPEIVDLDESYP